MKSLLKKDSLAQRVDLSHKKWFRSVEKSNITIKEQVYRLAKTDNKRMFIYKDGVAVDTRAFKVEDNKISCYAAPL